MEIFSVNFIHLLEITRNSCKKCNNRPLWQESNLRPCDGLIELSSLTCLEISLQIALSAVQRHKYQQSCLANWKDIEKIAQRYLVSPLLTAWFPLQFCNEGKRCSREWSCTREDGSPWPVAMTEVVNFACLRPHELFENVLAKCLHATCEITTWWASRLTYELWLYIFLAQTHNHAFAPCTDSCSQEILTCQCPYMIVKYIIKSVYNFWFQRFYKMCL